MPGSYVRKASPNHDPTIKHAGRPLKAGVFNAVVMGLCGSFCMMEADASPLRTADALPAGRTAGYAGASSWPSTLRFLLTLPTP